MFAGGRIRFEGALQVGDELRRRSTVVKMSSKVGRSGELVFVTVRHEVTGTTGASITEEQDLVYRGSSSGRREDERPGEDVWPEPTWSMSLPIDTTVLFRFSALTYNAHRIHYDRPYAIDTEGYPGLVVHGPLQVIALLDLYRRNCPAPLSSFEFRALRPAFDNGALRLCGTKNESGVDLSCFNHEGFRTTVGSATWLTGPSDE